MILTLTTTVMLPAQGAQRTTSSKVYNEGAKNKDTSKTS